MNSHTVRSAQALSVSDDPYNWGRLNLSFQSALPNECLNAILFPSAPTNSIPPINGPFHNNVESADRVIVALCTTARQLIQVPMVSRIVDEEP